MKALLSSLVLLGTLLEAGLDGQQEERRSPYVQSAVNAVVQPAGVANHRVTPPISGKTLGISAAAGAFATPTLAMEGEFAVGRTISTEQRFSYSWREDYIAQSRDLWLTGNVRWSPRRVRYLELVGGMGLTISTFAKRSIVRTNIFSSPTTSTAPDEVTRSLRPTVGGGIDTPLALSTRFDIVPTFRFRWVKRSADSLGAYSGVGSYVYHFGTTVRLKF